MMKLPKKCHSHEAQLSQILLQSLVAEVFSNYYSRTSVARTSLGSIVRDMGSSSHWGLIMVQGQEANSDD